jgi:DeoR/GlpR family transcriptional regulator of sugar metabolism
MLAVDRRSKLLEIVRRRGFASLPELAESLQVSESTVRRDLAHLEQDGAAKRTHGGAFYTGPTPHLPHFDQRQSSEWDKKKTIAEAAARLIDDADTLLLDGGSTTYELALLLVNRPLQIVTNSLPVANLFCSAANIDLVIVGGYVHTRSGTVSGTFADEMLNTLNVRRAVLSVAGVTERGLFNSNLLQVNTQRAMMKTADEVIIVADSTKFGHQSLAHMCDLADVDHYVVDEELPPGWRERIVAAGAALHLAPLSKTDSQQLCE